MGGWAGGQVGWDKVGSSGVSVVCPGARDRRSVRVRWTREAKPEADEYTREVKEGGAAMST